MKNLLCALLLGAALPVSAAYQPTAYDTNSDAAAQAFVLSQIGGKVATSNYLTSASIIPRQNIAYGSEGINLSPDLVFTNIQTNVWGNAPYGSASVYWEWGNDPLHHVIQTYSYPLITNSTVFAENLNSVEREPWAVEWAEDSTNVIFGLRDDGCAWQLTVNGSREASNHIYSPNTIVGDANGAWIQYVFTNRMMRHFMLQGDFRFRGLITHTNEQIFPLQRRQKVCYVIADSWGESAFQFPNYLHYRLKNTAAIPSGVGSTGYVKTNAPPATNYLGRIVADAGRFAPDYVLIYGSFNDSTNDFPYITSVGISNNAYLTFNAIHTNSPLTKIIVVGPQENRTPAAVPWTVARDAVSNASVAAGVACFIDPIADGNSGSWITGSYTNSTFYTNGNSQYYIAFDSHPTLLGSDYIGERIYRAILSAIPDFDTPSATFVTASQSSFQSNSFNNRLNFIPPGPVRLFFIGDSKTIVAPAAGVSNQWPLFFINLPYWATNVVFATNVAASGATIVEATNQYYTHTNLFAPPGSGTNNLIIIRDGANDFPTNSSISWWMNIYSNMLSDIQSRPNSYSCVWDIQPRTDHPDTVATNRNPMNQALRRQTNWTYIVKAEKLVPDAAATALFEDGIHANTNGALAEAQICDYAIRWGPQHFYDEPTSWAERQALEGVQPQVLSIASWAFNTGYTNTNSLPIMVRVNSQVVTAAVAGNAGFSGYVNFVAQVSRGLNTSASIPAQPAWFTDAEFFVPGGAFYSLTNSSSGAGNSVTLFGGQILILGKPN